MTGTGDPWRDIGPSKEDNTLNVRRADVAHPLDYWFARDVRGRYVFCFDASTSAPDTRGMPKFAGIDLVSLGVSDRSCRLVLTLTDSEQFDIFRALCSDLMLATRELAKNESADGLAITLNRLTRWQGMLERVRDDLLSQRRIIGLVGELLVLRDVLMPRLSVFDAVHSWRGPFGDEQDFLLAGRIIEVKTQLSTSDRFLNISSEQQLDTASGPIVVCHQTLDVPANEGSGAASLNGLISSLSGVMAGNDFAAVGLFRSALLEAGYRRRDEYDRPYWLLNGRSFFEVREGFPRIVPEIYEAGIDRVRYRVAVQACADFEIGEEAAVEWVFDGGS